MKLKLHLLLCYPSTWYICDFFLIHIEIEGICGWIIGGGAKGYVAPLSNYWGGGGGGGGAGPPAPPPLPTLMQRTRVGDQ